MRHLTGIAIALLILAGTGLPGAAYSADETVYGWQLMTEQEREEHRNKMRTLQTEKEREAYRQEHHERMEKRAKERGVTLPSEPAPRGTGPGPVRGTGPGTGSGSGSGNR